jgi:hypothetical protein
MPGRLYVAGVLALWLCTTLEAQPPVVSPVEGIEQRIVTELLASGDDSRRAWGAYLAGNYGQTNSIPELRRMLASSRRDLAAYALDSPIRLDAAVPSEHLLALWPNHRAPIMILLARAAKDNQEGLRRLAREDLRDPEWVAVQNLLVMVKAPGLAAELLEALKVRISLSVVDSEDHSGFGSGIGGGGCGCGGSGFRPGLPPPYSYSLSQSPQPGDVILAPGLHPIYYRRQQGASECFISVDRNRYRFEYIGNLLHTRPEYLPLKPELSRKVLWKGSDGYLIAVRQLREEVNAGFRSLARMLQESGLATARETDGLRVQLELHAVDTRQTKQPPLPPLPPD